MAVCTLKRDYYAMTQQAKGGGDGGQISPSRNCKPCHLITINGTRTKRSDWTHVTCCCKCFLYMSFWRWNCPLRTALSVMCSATVESRKRNARGVTSQQTHAHTHTHITLNPLWHESLLGAYFEWEVIGLSSETDIQACNAAGVRVQYTHLGWWCQTLSRCWEYIDGWHASLFIYHLSTTL